MTSFSHNKSVAWDVGAKRTHASDKDASAFENTADNKREQFDVEMENCEKRNNAAIAHKNVEVEAATKIQASFRGYQVRKQMKGKVSLSHIFLIKFFFFLI